MISLTKTLEEWDEDIQCRVAELREAKTARNAAVPINARLPPELLCSIFAEYQRIICQNEHGRGYRWLAVCHVCRHWRTLSLGNPQFWQRIFLNEHTSEECVKEIIARSDNSPLIVTILLRQQLDTKQHKKVMLIQETIVQHLPRIGSLAIRANKDVLSEAIQSLDKDAPLLTSLSLIAVRDKGMPPLPLPAIKSAPKLSTVELAFNGVTLTGARHLLTPALKELSIRLRTVPKSAELQAALSGLPHLGLLHIYTPLDYRPDTIFADRPTSMPRMRSLRVVGSTWTCAFLLNSLSVPTNTSFNIDCAPEDASYRDMDHAVLGAALCSKMYDEREGYTWPLVNLGMHATRSRVTLSWWREPDPIKLWQRKFHRRMVIVHVFATSFHLETFCTALGIGRTKTLVLGSFSSLSRQRWVSIIAQMKHVEQMTIMNTTPSSPASLYSVLEERVSQRTPTLLLPNLHTLYLSAVSFRKGDPDGSSDAETVPPEGPSESEEGQQRAVVMLSSFKAALDVRVKENLPVSSVVFTKPVGLHTEHLEQFRGLVESVKWDDEVITFKSIASEAAMSDDEEKEDSVVSPAAAGEGSEDADVTMILHEQHDEDTPMENENHGGDGDSETDSD